MKDTRTSSHIVLRSYTTTDGKVHEHLPPAKRHESKLAARERLVHHLCDLLGITSTHRNSQSAEIDRVVGALLEYTNIIKIKTLIEDFSPPLEEVKERVITHSTKVQN